MAREECLFCRATGLCHCTLEVKGYVEVDAMLMGLQCVKYGEKGGRERGRDEEREGEKGEEE